MRWTKKHNSKFYNYKGRNKGFNFTIHAREYSGYYVTVSHCKKDIRLNTLWAKQTFETFEDAEEFCKTFDHKKHRCLGSDL
jgi:hypothetical protein